MKILIIKYLPSGEKSNTLKLLNYFKDNINTHEIEEIDLIETIPTFHNRESMALYKARNFGGETLTQEQQKVMAQSDLMTQQFVNADLIVLATPMHNFSLPGIVKTYFDAVMQSGITFKYEGDRQIGLMDKSKFLTIYTSMGSYKGGFGYMDNLRTITKIELDFMGFKAYEFVHASTGNHATYDMYMNRAQEQLQGVCEKWEL